MLAMAFFNQRQLSCRVAAFCFVDFGAFIDFIYLQKYASMSELPL